MGSFDSVYVIMLMETIQRSICRGTVMAIGAAVQLMVSVCRLIFNMEMME